MNPVLVGVLAAVLTGVVIAIYYFAKRKKPVKSIQPTNAVVNTKIKDRPAMLDDLLFLAEQQDKTNEKIDLLSLQLTEFMKAIHGNGSNGAEKTKDKSPTEKVIELLSQTKIPLTDTEIAEKIGSTSPAVKKILSTNFETENIPGLANLGKGKWMIIKPKEEPEKKEAVETISQ